MTNRHGAVMRARQWLLAGGLLLATGWATAQPATVAVDAPRTAAKTVLVMGDSLSAGYGLSADEGWVPLMAQRIAQRDPGWSVVNASISGETTAGGSARVVDEVLRHRPSVVVIALGANDALRGLPLQDMRRNLARMIGASRHVGAKVLLVGMRMPPNLGAEYTRGFEQTYRDLATLFDVELLPFLLEPIAADRTAFQDDNLHPTAAVQARLRDHVFGALEPMLR
ncbi:MAG TPA: arylesterase [Luteimonas sp.]|nr:arylesterase [Luteimonas sp.]